MVLRTPFHPRLSELNTTGLYGHWAGYLSALKYDMSAKHEYFGIRNSAGVFDTSPLYKYWIRGRDAERFLAGVMTRDIRTCRPGRAQYTVWCDDAGYVLEDGVLFRHSETEFLLTCAEPNLGYFRDLVGRLEVELEDATTHFGMLAVQGPRSRDILAQLAPEVTGLGRSEHREVVRAEAPALGPALAGDRQVTRQDRPDEARRGTLPRRDALDLQGIPPGRSAQPSEGGLDRAARVDGRHRGAIFTVRVDVGRDVDPVGRVRGGRGDRVGRSVGTGERGLDGTSAIGHLTHSGQRDVRSRDPTRSVREDHRCDTGQGIAGGRLLERRIRGSGIVARTWQADLRQDLALAETGHEGSFEETIDRRRPLPARRADDQLGVERQQAGRQV
jgi:hypothetical protein